MQNRKHSNTTHCTVPAGEKIAFISIVIRGGEPGMEITRVEDFYNYYDPGTLDGDIAIKSAENVCDRIITRGLTPVDEKRK